MKLSILVVSFNTKEYTKACIESFVKIRRDDCELIVLDNHSKDGTREYLEKVQENNIHIILNDCNIGFAKGMNICYKQTKGEYVMTFNPDAILYENTLGRIIEYLDKHKDVGLVALANKSEDGSIEYPEVDFKLINKIETLKWKLPRINLLEGNTPILNWIWGTGITIRKQTMGQDAMFVEDNFLFWEEYYLAKYIKNQGLKMVLLKDTFINHHGSVSFKKNAKLLEKVRLLSWYNGHLPKTKEYGNILTFLSYIFILLDSTIAYLILSLFQWFSKNDERILSIVDQKTKIVGSYNLLKSRSIIANYQKYFVEKIAN